MSHTSTSVLPLRERAPVTDKEWADELNCYARDRQRAQRARARSVHGRATSSTSRSASATPSQRRRVATAPPPGGPHVRPLVHHGDSYESIAAQAGGSDSVNPEKMDESDEHVGPATLDYHSLSEGLGASCSRGDGAEPMGPTPLAFDVAPTAPDATYPDDEDDTRSMDKERRRLRTFYEKEGWLPGPVPCRATRLRRRRAIRRLGLVGEEEADDRKRVLSKYAEMAELIFNVPRAVISIIHDEKEYAYFADPGKPPEHRPTHETACSHVIGIEEDACWVVRDWSVDWRMKNNPTCLRTEHKFLAAAPLRYHGKDGSTVDFGTINIYDIVERKTFDERERSLLLKLANMLVFQLATLQSECMAKRSGALYEASISFLRRSLLPEQLKDDRPKSPKGPSRPPSPSRELSVHPRVASLTGRATTLPGADKESAAAASKAGPRNRWDARRKAIVADQGLFDDAANTLQLILKADSVVVVNMEDYQLFIRKSVSETLNHKLGKERIESKERIIHDYMNGLPWPEDVEPVITYTGQGGGAQILGQSTPPDRQATRYQFDSPGAEATLSDYLKSYLETRHFWWDREDTTDELSNRIMQLMPTESQTALGTTFLGSDGKVRFAMFATWNEPPSSLADSSMVALPFVWVLGGCLMAALASRKMRALEESQISYSNLQAHELRTPLHQILAMTQMLRSSMTDLAQVPPDSRSLTSNEQVRDLVPLLDAIDTSGKTLHGIVDNILSFLELKSKDGSQSTAGATMVTTPKGSENTLEVMFEELIHAAIEEDQRTRRANGLPSCHIETIFEIIPPLLGEQVSEDAGGALKRALSKLLSNAYKFMHDHGCVEIYVDDVPDLLPPEGCEDIALTKYVSIVIKDNGKGMDQSFVKDRLGEPWAKEDSYATGSGLSVHLAYRIIELMGGCLEITSAAGVGTTVQLDVPLPVRSIPFPESSDSRKNSAASIRQLTVNDGEMEINRKVALIGFEGALPLKTLGAALKRQYEKLGCKVVPLLDAELVIVEGHVEEDEAKGVEFMDQVKEHQDVVFLVTDNHSACHAVTEAEKHVGSKLGIRRFRKPATPSILRETLFPNHSGQLKDRFESETDADAHAHDINTPNLIGSDGRDIGKPGQSGYGDERGRGSDHAKRPSNKDEGDVKCAGPGSIFRTPFDQASQRSSGSSEYGSVFRSGGTGIEGAVASLSLGDYFSTVSPKTKMGRSDLPPRSPDSPSTTATDEYEDRTPMPVQEVGEDSDMSVMEERRQSVILSSEYGSSNRSSVSEHTHSPVSSLQLSLSPLQPQSQTWPASQPPDKDMVKVLVVEDNKINRTILVKILSAKQTIKVFQAEDGDEAVNLFRDLSGPVVVLLDINMPRKDGYQACIEMRGIEREPIGRPRQKAEIIAVTALASEEEKKRGLVECNFDEWHTKPCGKAQLLKIVDQACKRLQRGAHGRSGAPSSSNDAQHEADTVAGETS